MLTGDLDAIRVAAKHGATCSAIVLSDLLAHIDHLTKYERELERAASLIQEHPMFKDYKGIGLLEVAAALEVIFKETTPCPT